MDEPLARQLSAYQPSPSVIKLIKTTRILLLVGPTGAGKDALKQRLLQTGKYHHIVSHTTRPPRINHGVTEENGRDYHFIDQATASQMLNNHALVEAKIYSGNLYGTSVAEIQKAHDDGKIAMTDIEVQGVAEYKSLDPGVMAVFLLPPDFHTWQERLQRRYGDVVDADDARRRLQTALSEIDQLLITDYYVPIINDDLNVVSRHIEAITGGQPENPKLKAEARNVAKQLAHDIQAFLDRTA